MAGEFTPPSTSLSKSFFDKLVYNASIHQKHPACGNVHEWQVFDREKGAVKKRSNKKRGFGAEERR